MKAITICTLTHPARALLEIAKHIRAVESCLDGVFTLELALQILRERADPANDALPHGATILVEGEGGFVYQTLGGTTFGLLPVKTWVDMPVEGNRFGQHIVVLGFHREGSVIDEGLKLWHEHKPEVIDFPEGEVAADAVRSLWQHMLQLREQPAAAE